MSTHFNISIVKKLHKGSNSLNISIIDYTQNRIDGLWCEGKIRSWKKYRVFLNKLIAFLEQNPEFGIKFPVSKISVQFVYRFESFLKAYKNQVDQNKVLHNNTVVVNMQVLKAIVNRAINIDNLISVNNAPFRGHSLKRCASSRAKLSLEEIRLLENIELTPGSIQWNARNMFLFSFYCAGIRVGDLLQLKWENIQNSQRLTYFMDKNRKRRDILLVDKAKEILQLYREPNPAQSDFIFPFLKNETPYSPSTLGSGTLNPDAKLLLVNKICESTRRLNKALSQVSGKAGISKRVTMHVSRHSFAGLAREMGIESTRIQSLLAHSSLRTTEIYMGSFNTDESDKVLIGMFDRSANPKAGR